MGLSGPRLGRTLNLLHRKSGQQALLSMTNTTDVSWVYQTADRADDRTDSRKRLVSLVTIFQQNHPTTTTSFHCQPLTEGTLAPGCFCDGLLTGLLFIQCWWEASLYWCAPLGRRVYLCADIYTPYMLMVNEWLQACWWMRSIQGRHPVSALMIGCSSLQEKPENLKAVVLGHTI